MAAAGLITTLPKDCISTHPKVGNSKDEPEAFCRSPILSNPALAIDATHIVSSPYPNLTNQLKLRDLERPVRLFALAMTILRPTRADFRTGPYMSIFNWNDVFRLLKTLRAQSSLDWPRQEFYVVVFRSKLRDGIDRDRLGELDQRSHEEACASGGLLKYWFGTTDEENRNLATCKYGMTERIDAQLTSSKAYGATKMTPEQVAVGHGTDWHVAQLAKCTKPSVFTLTS
nr:upf0643 protein [Quercus suber]